MDERISRQIVGAKWVYTIKTDQNEKESYKAGADSDRFDRFI